MTRFSMPAPMIAPTPTVVSDSVQAFFAWLTNTGQPYAEMVMGPDPAQTLVVATWSPNHTDPQQVTRFLPHLEVHQDATWKASRPATHTAHDRLALASLAPTVHKAWNAHLLAFHRSVKSPAMLEYDFAWERHLFGLSLAISAVNVDQNTLTRRSIVTPHDLASFAQSVRHEHGGV